MIRLKGIITGAYILPSVPAPLGAGRTLRNGQADPRWNLLPHKLHNLLFTLRVGAMVHGTLDEQVSTDTVPEELEILS